MQLNGKTIFLVCFITGGMMLLVGFSKLPAESLLTTIPLVLGYYFGEYRAIYKSEHRVGKESTGL